MNYICMYMIHSILKVGFYNEFHMYTGKTFYTQLTDVNDASSLPGTDAIIFKYF
jgi:hypothetical protein